MDFEFLEEPEPPARLGAADALAFLGTPEIVQLAASEPPPPMSATPGPGKARAEELGVEIGQAGFDPLPVPHNALEYRAGLKELKRRGIVLEARCCMLSLSEIQSPSVTHDERERARQELTIVEKDLQSATERIDLSKRALTDAHWLFFLRRRKLRAHLDELGKKKKDLRFAFGLTTRIALASLIDEAAALRQRAKAAVEKHMAAAEKYKLKYAFLLNPGGGAGGGGGPEAALSDDEEAVERREWYKSLRESDESEK